MAALSKARELLPFAQITGFLFKEQSTVILFTHTGRRKSIMWVYKMFCGLLNFYCIIEEVLSERVAQAAGALSQDISIFHYRRKWFCLLVVLVHLLFITLHSPVSCVHSTSWELLPNSQSRFGHFCCCLPLPWPRPRGLPLPDHLGLLEVSRFWARTGAVFPRFALGCRIPSRQAVG